MSATEAVLEARLAELEAREEVLATLAAYSWAIDAGEAEAWVDCFTPDGAFTVRSHLPGYPSRRHEGAAALREFIDSHTRPPEAHHKHLYLLPEVEIDGDEARARAYFVHLLDRDARPVILSYGLYLDTLRRGEDGRWRIAERVAEVEASADLGADSIPR